MSQRRRGFQNFKERRFQGGSQGRSQNRIRYMNVDPRMLVRKAEPETAQEYVPTHTFEDFGLSPVFVKNVRDRGYTVPTPIQDQVIPIVMQGRDVVGLASTGTGKTMAFLLPLLHKIEQNPNEKILIVTPTRELAVQILEEGREIAQGTRIYFALVIGGVDIGRQVREMRRRPQVVVGTPGRIKDLTERGEMRLKEYQTIVLDEVDRMLDMGFVHDITAIVTALSSPRHSLFFSATMSDRAKRIAQTFLTEPKVVQIAAQSPSANVDQDIVKLGGRNKIDVLHDLLIQPGFEKVLVFGRTKHGMEKLSRMLSERGFATAAIHGNKSQNQRQRALNAFKRNDIKVLLATDVAARGIDIDKVTHVINYELPETYEDYIHRIGRTGRANCIGKALTFID